ncbi:MAG: SepM family pheromone-processing serine protease [Thermoactinomyces sp.]|jgi:PDZ domain-containing protein
MGFRQSTKKRIIGIVILSLILIVIGVLFLVRVPYFVISPGLAQDVSPMVHVGNIRPHEKGTFMLTTISLKDGNLFDYAYVKLTGKGELVPENQILAQNESEEEYQRREAENMTASQNQAIIAAFRYAKKPVRVEIKGIEVFQLIRKQPQGLREGDIIRKVDGRPVQSVDQLIHYLSTKKAGDTVAVGLVRGGKAQTLTLTLSPLPAEPGEKPRVGLGIIPVPRIKVITSPPAWIEADQIGGPSAGLMFSLEVLNRLLPEDLTHGRRIAGTGTISADGTVGQIGGIQHKLVAAERKHAQIFFCPEDVMPGDQNEKIAKETIKKEGLHLKLVPVKSLADAVHYLQRLPKATA